MRDWLQKNPAASGGGAVALLVIALGLLFWQSGGAATGGGNVYFYDAQADALFTAGADAIPPIDTPGGGSGGVIAHVYACGECPGDIEGMTLAELEQAGAFVNHFQRYDDDAKRILDRGADGLPAEKAEERLDWAQIEGVLIQAPGDEAWHRGESLPAVEIEDARFDACPGAEPPQRCRP